MAFGDFGLQVLDRGWITNNQIEACRIAINRYLKRKGKVLSLIHICDMTLQFYLLPYLEQFHREYPKIKVNVTNAPTPKTIKSLEEGRIDFGVVTTPFTLSLIHI